VPASRSNAPPYLIVESIPHLVWVAGPDGTLRYVNRRWQRYTGLSLEQARAGRADDIIHPADLPSLAGKWQTAQEAGEDEVECRLRRADGAYLCHSVRALPLHDEYGNITNWVGTCTDIEDHRLAEQAQARLAAIVENSDDAITSADNEGRVLTWNPGAERLYGYTAAEMVGRPFSVVVPPGLWDEVPRRMAMVARGQAVATFETVRLRKDGRRIDVSISVAPLRDASGKVVGGSAITRDISARKRLEEQFLQAQKMEAVGRLAGGIAHEFNNLLTVINGYAALLLQDLGATAPATGPAHAILKAGERAAGLTRQLLTFSRKQIVAPRVFDLNAVVTDTEALLRRLIGEDVLLTKDLQAGLGAVRADPTQVQQVVLNLAVNARDAMPDGGRLSIATRDAGEYVLLAVTDTGCGMTDEVQAHLFEPFFTTKGPGKGTGLGLSTVYGIVKQSGGHIEVESQPGMGTTVRVHLPRGDEAPAEEKPPGDGLPPRGTETVLLAEDEDEVRALVRQVLQGGGYTVLEARDGAEALAVATRYDGPIDLLVTDVVMPGVDGRGLAERLSGRYPRLKVLYLSGYTDDAVVRRGVSQEEAHFLQKPFSPAVLARKVREVLDAPPRT
jgi:PAS domain S-box-containing protein